MKLNRGAVITRTPLYILLLTAYIVLVINESEHMNMIDGLIPFPDVFYDLGVFWYRISANYYHLTFKLY